MKIVVEAMCAEYGGISIYVENLVRTWPSVFPDDELFVIGPLSTEKLPRQVTVQNVAPRRPRSLFRPVAQTKAVKKMVDAVDADVVLATLPSTTLLKPAVLMAVVVYDLCHELRPDQFSRKRRVLRRFSYARGYALADSFIAISQRSLNDLHSLHPETRQVPSSVVYLGADHVDSWAPEPAEPFALAFGHHKNKNVDLVLDAWASLVADTSTNWRPPPLKLVGVGSDNFEEVQRRVNEIGLADWVELLPFLPDAKFQSVMASSSMVVFPSDFEGFGLPVVEAMRLGIPIVVGPEPAVLEVAGGHATASRDWTAQSFAQAVRAAPALGSERLSEAETHGRTFTWARAVHETRQTLERMIAAEVGTQSPM